MTHTHDHSEPLSEADVAAMYTQQFWDERYAGSSRVWSGKPNQRLVEMVTGMEPGSAIDVGCGEGADVVWLAEQGWSTTGVDVSQVAIDRAAAHAEEAGVGARTAFDRVDVIGGHPLPGAYQLVTSAYLHPPLTAFASTYSTLRDAVLPGGTLLVIGHHPADSGTGLRNPALVDLMFTPEQVVALLDDSWDVEVAGTPTRPHTHDGVELLLTDTVVKARRR
jgi:SAM-dependent methyltransferase